MKSFTKAQIGIVFAGCFALILVAFAVLPSGVTANDGLSYYGIHLASLLPYGAALALNALGMVMASRLLAAHYGAPVLKKTVWLYGHLPQYADSYALQPQLGRPCCS